MSNLSPAAASKEDNFAALFEESLTRQEMRVGEVITAEVVRVDMNFVVVNAGLKSESFIPVEEFRNDAGEIEVKVGDFVTSTATKLCTPDPDQCPSGTGPTSEFSRAIVVTVPD